MIIVIDKSGEVGLAELGRFHTTLYKVWQYG